MSWTDTHEARAMSCAGINMIRCHICEKGDTHIDAVSARIVIPAKAGIHRQYEAWIPAFAGMTYGDEMLCGGLLGARHSR
ncbi:hypothetical protein [Dyella nitratireducens]|uniref:Uncharacterized protein n=1 Tax=Dyella nitratireducens TaxID=1849580 RepID=A0ABQ1FX75_9GAMM|nr:hypothetical protein [Dyella nitratireducens]GGA31859.1 hypothetical protein GCM10010981_21220 [Dyella nitratireducens]GLQ42815.1 hypothetical protein GCM10007902_26650 [Dyella nitratireducens]